MTVEAQFFPFFDEFGEIDVGGQVLVSGVGKGICREGMLAESAESACEA